uniref:FtsK domain-containing protein n=1 Tax=candidate division WOR-3 bacterium TaxID=2052148 RepID=A0A7C3Z1S6_UNCW3
MATKRNEKVKTKRRRGEFFGFLLLLIALLFFVSLFSYHLGERTKERNYCGAVGSFLSGLLTSGFGLFSYLFVFFLSLFAWNCLLGKERKKAITFALKVGLFAFLFHSFLGYLNINQEIVGGFGLILGNFFHYLLGSFGGFILFPGLMVLFLLVFTGIRIPAVRFLLLISHFFSLLFKALRRFFLFFFGAIPNFFRYFGKGKIREETKPVLAGEEGRESPREEEAEESAEEEEDFAQEFVGVLTSEESGEIKNEKELKEEAATLLSKLKEFDIDGEITGILTGPVITRFEFQPAPGIKIQRIESLADDLALSLRAERIRILAPIPGKAAVGIEIPNKKRKIVRLRPILESGVLDSSPSPLSFVLGDTITGEPYIADLRQMPHILIAGTTGSGKSVCINCILSSIIYRSTPDEVRFLTIDPKQLELPVYDPIPHLLGPTTTDPQSAPKELDRIIQVMEMRYSDFARVGVRDIESYNARSQELGRKKKPYIVVVVDELADLMKTVKEPQEMERRITRLAQMSRAVGIHLILATQRPSVDVITGLIKANFPCRIAFQVASKTDSRTILDMNGAESLLGMGDMLFLPPGKGEPIRLHGAFISVEETKRLVNLWAKRYLRELLKGLTRNPGKKAEEIVKTGILEILINKEKASIEEERKRLSEILSEEIADKLLSLDYHIPLEEEAEIAKIKKEEVALIGEIDEYFAEAARFVFQLREASVSMLQRKLDVGWARAGRIIDQLERAGIVGPYAGSKSRRVLVETEEELEKILRRVLRQ